MVQPLRVALISEHASPLATIGGVDAGGQNIHVDQVARGLARLGHHVDVLTRRDDPAVPAVVEIEPRCRVVHVDAGPAAFVEKERLLPHMPAFARGAEAVLRRGRHDLVHAHFFMSGWVAQRLREALGVPFVTTFHALGLVRRQHQREADRFPPERLGIERALVRGADALIAECPQDQDDLERLYQADPSRIRVVPCGVDAEEFSPMPKAEARAALGLPDDEFVVLQLGRLVPRKGIDDVVRALARLPASLPARLVVVGGDSEGPDERATPEIARLRRIASEAGVADRVVFTGHRARRDLRRYYAAADVFVTTPWYEPFGITPLEAMACGTPVVGSAVGGIPYTVVDGVTGFLVPPRDPGALAERLLRLHAEPALGASLGRAGIARTRALFSWNLVARALAGVYAEVVERRLDPTAEPAAWPLLRTA